jgi:hypothetical protein
LLEEFKKYAKDVKGVECSSDWLLAKNKGLNVIQERVSSGTEIPEADVYYIWVCSPREILNAIPQGKTIIVSAFNCFMDDIPKHYQYEVREVVHNESGKQEIFKLWIIRQ